MTFVEVDPNHTRMYFSMAVHADHRAEEKKLAINRKVLGNGALFRTRDPRTAVRNDPGAHNDPLRDVIRQL
jgi:hypothetical protein